MSLSRQARPMPRKKKPRRTEAAGLVKQLSSDGVEIPNRKEVLAYLRSHKQLAKLFPEISAQTRRAFGTEVELSLEIYHDPEIEDRYLTLYIRQHSYDIGIMDRIETVSHQFNERLEQVSGYLLLTTDFHRPRTNHAV